MAITPSYKDSIIAFCWRTSRPISRGSRRRSASYAAGKEPGEDKQGDQQQHGGNQNIDHFTDGNGVEVAGEIAHGNNAHHLSGIVEDGALLRSEMPSPPLRMVVVLFPAARLRYRRHQRCAHSVGKDGMKKMLPLLSPITIKLASLCAAIFCIKSWIALIFFLFDFIRNVGISAISSACIFARVLIS
jgi:hypothetical protein